MTRTSPSEAWALERLRSAIAFTEHSGQEFEQTYASAVAMHADGSVIVVGADARDGTDYDLWIQRLAR